MSPHGVNNIELTIINEEVNMDKFNIPKKVRLSFHKKMITKR
jgi:hypothetical protein